MEYEKTKDGKIIEVHSPVVKRELHNADEYAIYLAKKRGDIIRDIEIRQQELADLEAAIASFDTVSDIEVGEKTPDEIITELQTLEKAKELESIEII